MQAISSVKDRPQMRRIKGPERRRSTAAAAAGIDLEHHRVASTNKLGLTSPGRAGFCEHRLAQLVVERGEIVLPVVEIRLGRRSTEEGEVMQEGAHRRRKYANAFLRLREADEDLPARCARIQPPHPIGQTA